MRLEIPDTERFRALLRDRRVRGIGTLTTTSAATSTLTLALLPVITRIYPPETYASFALVLAASAIIATIGSGRYEVGIVVVPHNPETDREAWNLARLAIAVSLASSALLVAVALGLVTLLPEDFTWPPLAVLSAPIIGLMMMLGGVQSSIDTRGANYSVQAKLSVVRAVILVSSQIALGLIQASAFSLIAGLALSLLPSLVRLGYLMARAPKHPPVKLRRVARAHARYPGYQVWAALANNMSISVLIFFVAAAFDEVAVGLFSIALRVVLFPATFISGAVNTVYMREAARIADQRQRARSLYKRLSGLMMLAGLAAYLAAVPVVVFGFDLMGQEWAAAKPVTIAAIPLGLGMLVATMPNAALIAYGKQEQLLLWRVVLVIAAPAIILAGGKAGSSLAITVGGAALAQLAAVSVYAWWGFRWVVSRSESIPLTVAKGRA